MKRLWRDLLFFLLAIAPVVLLDALGAFRVLAAKLESAAAAEAPPSMAESAPWRPPAESAPQSSPAPAPDPPRPGEPSPSPEAAETPSDSPLPAVRIGGKRTPDLHRLLREGWSCTLGEEGPQILILHSHTCEAFTPEGEDRYTPSGDWRTLEEGQSVVALGDLLTQLLEEKGFSVLHDREKYDWPAYNGAYDRSGEAVRAILEANPTIRVVIDLHRDALGGKKTHYAAPDGTDSAQVMLLLTTGENGLYHPNWQENLKLGLEVQRQMETDYPGLARDLDLSPARYNQHLSPGSFLLEVGTEANTLQEAKNAVSLFADCLAAVLETHRERPQAG